LGFPIRTSPDHSSVVNFPGLIADSYVLHRLLMPRHPPCALSSLSFIYNKIATKMLASTMQFSRYGRYHPRMTFAYTSEATPKCGREGPFEGRDGPRGASRAIPQDPTVCLTTTPGRPRFPLQQAGCTHEPIRHRRQIVDVPPTSNVASRHSLEKRRLDSAPKRAAAGSLERR
jgi:hypothetical protein